MQESNLNLIPSGDMPIVYASQYDKNRVIRFNLFDGNEEYTLSGTEIVKCNIRKNDEHIVVIVPMIGNNKYIDVVLTEQACACFGDNIGEITISSDENTLIGTINFILKVERNPIQGGVTSASDIADLETQIEDIVHEVMSDDYYTRDEVDAKLDLKANTADVYTKSEVDTALSSKANATDVYTKTQVDTALGLKADKSDTYTKTQVDTALALKADSSSVYTKSEVDAALASKANASDVYTKTEVDEIIEGLYPVNSASGSIANFTTSLVKPLTALSSTIVAQQAGSGTPSPSNPRAISGYDEVGLTHTGKNLLNNDTSVFNIVSQNYLQAKMPSVPKIISLTDNDTSVALTGVYFGAFKEYADSSEGFVWLVNNGTISRRSFDITDYDYITVYPKTALQTVFDRVFVQVETGSTATAYEAYDGETKTITLPSTVYGGVLDAKSGKLVVTHGVVDLGDLNWSNGSTNTSGVFRKTATISNAMILSEATVVPDIKCEIYGKTSPLQTYRCNEGVSLNVNTPQITIYDSNYNTGSSAELTAFIQAVSGKKFVYPLATPVEITGLTPANFTTFAGENNIFADCGDVEVSYKQGIQEYIDAKLGG